MQPRPAFVLDLSHTDRIPWTSPAFPSALHATYRLHRRQVLLFGPNHLTDADGNWTCETASRAGQHIAFYNSPAYQHIYRGPKPTVRPTGEEDSYDFSIEHLFDDEIPEIDEDVFVATALEPDNWGRWLSTVIPKIAYFKQQGLDGAARFLCRASKSWQKALLNTLGLASDMIVEHDPGRTYLCRRIDTLVYSAADLTPNAAERDIYAKLVRQHCDSPDRHIRLYVSRLARSAAAPGYRVLTNEAELVDRLIELGFQIVNPELHGFVDQISMFSAADFVLGLGGAGMFNVVFCRPATKVVTIESSTVFINDHSRLFAACGLSYGVIFGRQDESDPAPVHKRWSVDVDRTIQAVSAFL